MSTRSNTPLPRRPPPRSRAAPNGGLRLRQVLAAGNGTGQCVPKTFDCSYCVKDAYYMYAKKLTAFVAVSLAALSAFVVKPPKLLSPTDAIDVMTNLGAQMRDALVIVPWVQEWWRATSESIKVRLKLVKSTREMTFASGFHVQTWNYPSQNIPWYLRFLPTEQQEDVVRALGLLWMTFRMAQKIVSENATVGQIVTSINDGPERWIRLLAGFFRAQEAHKQFGGDEEWSNFGFYVWKATTDVLQGECDEPANDQADVSVEQMAAFINRSLEQQPLLLTYHEGN